MMLCALHTYHPVTALAEAQVAEEALVEPHGACIPAKSSTFVNHDRTVCLDAGLRGSTVVRSSCVLPSLSTSVLLRYSLRFSMGHSSREICLEMIMS